MQPKQKYNQGCRKSNGSSTSASNVGRCGFREEWRFRVENGKLVTLQELIDSVDAAATRFLALHCPKKHRA